MRILTTGSTGFVGSALVQALVTLHGRENVFELVRYVSSGGGRFDYYAGKQRIFADLRDGDSVRAAIVGVKPDVVVHLAAQSAVAYSFQHPDEVLDVVLNGTVRVANACREAGAWLLHASTSEVYGRGDHTFPLTEDEQIGGTSPYAAAKVGAEEYLRVLMNTYKMPITIMRPFNTIGRAPRPLHGYGGNRHFVVERAVTQALSEGRIDLHDPRPLRDFMFRDSHVAGYLAALSHPDQAKYETFNLCTGDCWSIEKMAYAVADIVERLTGKAVDVTFKREPDRPLDIPRLQGSNAKARRVLGWEPQYSIHAGLERAVQEWMVAIEAEKRAAG